MTDDAYKVTVKTDYDLDTGLISQTVDGPGFVDIRSQMVTRVIQTQAMCDALNKAEGKA